MKLSIQSLCYWLNYKFSYIVNSSDYLLTFQSSVVIINIKVTLVGEYAMVDLKLIGNKIRALRLKKGLTQNEFATIMSVSFQAVSNWERGIAPPDINNIVRIAEYFGVLVDDILRPGAEELFLGVDGGGTKTEFVLVSSDGCVLKQFTLEGCNPNDVGLSNSIAIISKGISDMLIEFPSIKSVFCGVAGVLASNNSALIQSDLKKRFPTTHLQVKTDSFNLFAMNWEAEMAVISGTGSVVFIRQDEKFTRLGGWGHLIDCGGSAYDIGRDAIRLAAHEEDMHIEHSLLGKAVLDKMGTDTVWAGISTVYSEGKAYVAKFAPTVFAAYKEGDKNALDIIDRNAKTIAELLNTGVRLHGARPLAIASGGMFENYSGIIIPHIKKYSEVELIVNDLPPVYGACIRAYVMETDNVPSEFKSNFKRTYRGGKAI